MAMALKFSLHVVQFLCRSSTTYMTVYLIWPPNTRKFKEKLNFRQPI